MEGAPTPPIVLAEPTVVPVAAPLPDLDTSPEGLAGLPAMDDGGGGTTTAGGGMTTTPPGAAQLGGAAGGSAAAGGSPGGSVEPHPGIEYLAEHPDVIKRILEQVSQRDRTSNLNIWFDEMGDGTLALHGTGSPGTAARLKSISVIRTPAEGVKHKGVTTPRPSCQWYAPSVAIVDFTIRDDSALAPAAALPTYTMDASKNVPTWSGQAEKQVSGVEGLSVRYFTPTKTDPAYMDGHNMTLYSLTGTKFYLMLVHKKRGNNAGKKRARAEEVDPVKKLRDGKRAFASIKERGANNPAIAQALAGIEAHIAVLEREMDPQQGFRGSDLHAAAQAPTSQEGRADLSAPVQLGAGMSTGGGTGQLTLGPTMRGGGGGVQYHSPSASPSPETLNEDDQDEVELCSVFLTTAVQAATGMAPSLPVPSWEHRMDEVLNELERIEEELSAVNVLVCLEQLEGDLATPLEVDIIEAVFGSDHVDVVSATSGAVGEALMGEQSYNIVHFIGHGDAHSQFCLRADVSGKHFDMEALCDVLRTHNTERGGKLRLVFFNACHSEAQGRLLRSIDVDDGGVASVMCVAGRIADTQIAVPFSRDFYNELSSQLSLDQDSDPDRAEGQWALCVDLAYHHARDCILSDPGRREVFSAHPMLLTQPEQDDPLIFVTGDWATTQPEDAHLSDTADRGYQKRLVAVAEQKNAIFVLRTGAGKTRIALRMAETALRRFPSKRIVFTAPTAPLVEQQMSVFAAELRQEAAAAAGSGGAIIRIGGHFGGKNRGDPDANLLFFTPAKLVDFLTRAAAAASGGGRGGGGAAAGGSQLRSSSISMESISLLIVDECHHTRGASPLTAVAELYRNSKRKPRYLGLTALPVKHDDDEGAASSEPIGFGAVRHDTSLEGLCACWMAHLDTVEPGSKEDQEMLLQVPVPDIIPRALDAPTAQLLKRRLQELKEQGLNPNSDDYEAAEIEAKLPLVVQELKHKLGEGDEFRAIVFVHNRTNAHFLLEKLKACSDLDGCGIRADCVTGHTKTGGMSQAHQKRVLERFRSGSLNLIVATSVAEEGLDIPQCNIVVRLDAAVTDIGFVQSRGRARYPQARYIVACTMRSEVEALVNGERTVLTKVWDLCSHHRTLPSPCDTIWEERSRVDPRGDRPAVAVAAAVAAASMPSRDGDSRVAQIQMMQFPPVALPPPPSAALPSSLKVEAEELKTVDNLAAGLQQKDPTMELNEFCQQTGIVAGPDYRETRLAEQLFQYSVSVGGGAATTGLPASTKKEAKKDAARKWLAQNRALATEAAAAPVLPAPAVAVEALEPQPEPEPLLLSPQAPGAVALSTVDNPVAALNEFCQASRRGAPRYKETKLGEQLFQYSVCVGNNTADVLGQPASNKKDAKKSAAAAWLAQYHVAAH